MKDSLNEILRVIKLTLEETPPEIAADIMERGIVLSGAQAELKNFDMLINEQTGMPVFLAERPAECVARGIGMALESIEILKKTTVARKK